MTFQHRQNSRSTFFISKAKNHIENQLYVIELPVMGFVRLKN